jgi:hypothetical protein
LQGMREASTVIEGKWLGPCNPGQKPGDASIPGMPNMNFKDMKCGVNSPLPAVYFEMGVTELLRPR